MVSVQYLCQNSDIMMSNIFWEDQTLSCGSRRRSGGSQHSRHI
jgi:hypothetical protein